MKSDKTKKDDKTTTGHSKPDPKAKPKETKETKETKSSSKPKTTKPAEKKEEPKKSDFKSHVDHTETVTEPSVVFTEEAEDDQPISLEKKNAEVESKKNNLKERKDLEGRIFELEGLLEKSKKKVKELNSLVADKDKELIEKEEEIELLDDENNRLNKMEVDFTAKMKELEEEKAILSTQVEELKLDIEILTEENELIKLEAEENSTVQAASKVSTMNDSILLKRRSQGTVH